MKSKENLMNRFNRLSFVDQAVLAILIAACSTVSLPHRAAASTENKPFVFEIKNLSKITIPSNYTAKDEPATEVVDNEQQIFEQNVAILQAYLESKGSPLAPYAADILQHENWKLVLAISNGESTMCKHQRYNNCWGVGGAWNLRHYNTFADGFADVNRFLTEKYVAKGADTPEKIVNKYVGHPNANWVYAVNQVLTQVNNLPMVD